MSRLGLSKNRPAEVPTRRNRWRSGLLQQQHGFRTVAVVAGAALLAGGIAGAGIAYAARPAVSTTAEYQAMKTHFEHRVTKDSNEASALQSELTTAQQVAQDANDQAADLDAREAKVKAGEDKLAQDQAALDAQTKAVAESQFTDGVHLVGTDVAPGMYRITSASNCYYAWKTGTGSDSDIVDNNIVSGPATVTLKAGEVFETDMCGTWTKVG